MLKLNQFKPIKKVPVKASSGPIKMDSLRRPSLAKSPFPSSFFDLPAGVDPVFPTNAFKVAPPKPIVKEEYFLIERPKAQLPQYLTNLPVEEPTATKKLRNSIVFEYAPEPGLVMKGLLSKKGAKTSFWRRRTTLLYLSHLSYYDTITTDIKGLTITNHQSNERPGILPLRDYFLIEDRNDKYGDFFVLRNEKDPLEIHYFQGMTEKSHKTWLAAIQKQMEESKQGIHSAIIIPEGKPKRKKQKYAHSLKRQKRPVAPILPKLFGLKLGHIKDIDQETQTPSFMAECCNILMDERHLKTEGLLRLSGSAKEIREIQERLDLGEHVNLREIHDVNVVAGLMKLFLRELQEPLFSFAFYRDWLYFIDVSDGQKTKYLQTVFQKLPEIHKNTIRVLFLLLRKIIEYQDDNLMTPTNVAIVISPNVLLEENATPMESIKDSHTCSLLIQYMVSNPEIFE